MKRFLLLSFIAVLSCQSSAFNQTIPADFVRISDTIPQLIFDIRYFSSKNFVGVKVDGYLAPECLLQQQAAEALKNAYQYANAKQLNLKVFDCYRPQRAVDHFMRWLADEKDVKTKVEYYPNLNKSDLIGGYIAEKSGHTRGSTLDLTLVELKDGQWLELDMGSPYDLFDPKSNTLNQAITGKALENRLLLKQIMEEAGFAAYDMEWWHFSLRNQPYKDTYFDFPVTSH